MLENIYVVCLLTLLNCLYNYVYTRIDEMLVGFCGRCKFKMYYHPKRVK